MRIAFFVFCILALSNPVLAQQKTNVWVTALDVPDIQIAKIFNDSNSTAGLLCMPSSKLCSAYIGADFTCEEKEKYPLLVNSATGANLLTTTCITFNKVQYLFFNDKDLDRVISAFESGGEVGFAMPMQSGQFKVMRFSSAGATAAIRTARTMPVATRSTQNQSL